MRISVWDIDNCLADDRHRIHLIDHTKQGDEQYRLYNEAAFCDPVCNLTLFTVFKKLSTPVFFTGRPERFREPTLYWLRQKLGINAIIEMRANDTVGITPVALKEQMLKKALILFGRDKIIAAFDDIPAVVDMYQRYDIPAHVLQVHSDLSSIYSPGDLK